MMKRICTVVLVWGMIQSVALAQVEPTARELPRWRGFNLLEMFYKGSSTGPFQEEDFQLISELGFNFVRLPMDYRIWIKDGNWMQFNETALQWVDQAVEYGRRYGVHVCLNFHRAPGYTVADPPEPYSLWTDTYMQAVCAMHWATFARRYKGIPNSRLSFNLFNEPAGVDPNTYAKVVGKLVKAIHDEDPNRLIIADGLDYAVTPCPDLIPIGVAQATRGYQPFTLTHYMAGWVAGADQYAVPMWPQPLGCAGYLYGPTKKDMQSPAIIEANLPEPFTLHVRVGTVSDSARLEVSVDREGVIWHQDFKPGPGAGPWKQVVYVPEWKVYQNLYDQEFVIPIAACRRRIQLDNTRRRLADDHGDRAATGGRPHVLHAGEPPLGRGQPDPAVRPVEPGGPLPERCRHRPSVAVGQVRPALGSAQGLGRRGDGRRVGRLQPDASRRDLALDGGLPQELAAGQARLGLVEFPWLVRRAGQRPGGRPVRELPRSQARP